MRKIDPSDVRADFQREVDALLAYMNRVRRALKGEAHEKQDISRLASNTFLSLYVLFERFLSDLFLAYLNRSFGKYQKWLEARVQQSVHERFGSWANSRTKFDTVGHARVTDLEAIVDPDGRNLTFSDAAQIRQRATEWLNPAHAKRIHSLSEHDERLIDTAHAIRDFLAHRSKASKKRMNAALATVTQGTHNRYLRRGKNKVHNVGFYLKGVFGGQRRVAIYAERFKEIAAHM